MEQNSFQLSQVSIKAKVSLGICDACPALVNIGTSELRSRNAVVSEDIEES